MNERVAPQLYLVTPPLKDQDGTAEQLSAALSATPFAAVLVRLAAGDERNLINRVKAIAPAVQRGGAALILDGHVQIVARSGADGGHLSGIDAFMDAAPSLKPDRIAGTGGLLTKHDAMRAAEQGADYVMFGEPDAQGHRPPFDAIVERAQWWAEVFETPCVAYANDVSEIVPLARTGAEFIAIGDFVFGDPRGIAPAVSAIARDIDAMEIAT